MGNSYVFHAPVVASVILLERKHFYGKKLKILWSTLKMRLGCSPIAPPFLPPMDDSACMGYDFDNHVIKYGSYLIP